jgi:hypothetical protein
MAELAAKVGLCRTLVDRSAVRDRRLSPTIAAASTALRLALCKEAMQPGASTRRAADVTIDGLRAEPLLRSIEFHPPCDLPGRPTHGKAVLDVDAQAGGAHDSGAAQLAGPSTARGAVGPVSLDAMVASELAMDRAAVAPHAPGNLSDAQIHLHQAAQAASLLKRKVAEFLSHGDPGHSRCRTWFVNLAGSSVRGIRPASSGVADFRILRSGNRQHRSRVGEFSNAGIGETTSGGYTVADLQAALNRFVREYNADHLEPFSWNGDPPDPSEPRN